VPEVPNAGKHHREAPVVSRLNDLGIADRAAGLHGAQVAPASAAAIKPSAKGNSASLATT
jgi:hypothetical protein